LEAARPSAIIDIIHSGEAFEVKEEIKATQKLQRQYTFFFHLSTSYFLQKHVNGAATCQVMPYVKHARC
jgi:hypothetical protein